jgi:hypothetical protein
LALANGTLGNTAENLLDDAAPSHVQWLLGKCRHYTQGKKPPINGMDSAFNCVHCHGILSVSDNFAIIFVFSAAAAESSFKCPPDASNGWGCSTVSMFALTEIADFAGKVT